MYATDASRPSFGATGGLSREGYLTGASSPNPEVAYSGAQVLYQDNFSTSNLAGGENAYNKEASRLVKARRRDGAKPGYASKAGREGSRRRKFLLFGGVGLLVVIVAAVAIPVAVKTKHSSSSGASKPSNKNLPTGPTSGGDGSTITTEDGSKFTYNNAFGGHWVDDLDDPFNNNAQAQSWSPPLNQSWDWNHDRIFG